MVKGKSLNAVRINLTLFKNHNISLKALLNRTLVWILLFDVRKKNQNDKYPLPFKKSKLNKEEKNK